MNNPLITEILYLTHDKWKDKTEVKYRDEFKNYLEEFLAREPNCEQDLTMIVEYGQEDKGLVIMTGVMRIFRKAYPGTHESILRREHTRKLKEVLKNDVCKS